MPSATACRKPQHAREQAILLGMFKSAPKHFWIFVLAGALELCLGLGFSIFVGMSHSWLYAMIIALGFFVTANILFMIAFKKIS